jgi:hypothetical protein
MEDYILHICPTINKNIKRFHNDKLYLRKDAIPKYILVSQIVCLGQIIIVILKAVLLFKGKCITWAESATDARAVKAPS